jgi:hypothetical protein
MDDDAALRIVEELRPDVMVIAHQHADTGRPAGRPGAGRTPVAVAVLAARRGLIPNHH